MRKALEIVVRDYGWIHTGLGAVGNLTFLVGSVFFLPAFEALKTFGVWLFIVGALLMLMGSLGDLWVKRLEAIGKGKWQERPGSDRRPIADTG